MPVFLLSTGEWKFLYLILQRQERSPAGTFCQGLQCMKKKTYAVVSFSSRRSCMEKFPCSFVAFIIFVYLRDSEELERIYLSKAFIVRQSGYIPFRQECFYRPGG